MNLRKIAIKTLLEIEEGEYSQILLGERLKTIADPRDKNLLTTIVYGVLRQRSRLDYIINSFSSRSFKQLDREVITALRVALFQIEFLDRVPARAAVNETVAALKNLTSRGAAGFANGLLRNYLRSPDSLNWPDRDTDSISYFTVYYSHPRWLVERWLKRYGEQKTERLLKYNNQPPVVKIRHNNLILDQEKFIQSFQKQGIPLQKNRVPTSYTLPEVNDIIGLPHYQQGGFYIQGEAATLAGLLLAPEPGMLVLDMAAGPGGKTTHLAQLMSNRGQIIALDKYPHKLQLIRDNCQRLGIKNVKTIETDARNFTTQKLFDRVLLDVPCTGLGLIAQKPEIKWNRNESDIQRLARLQSDLLQRGSELLKPGGIMLYSTCTLIREENQGNIIEFLQNNDNIKLQDLAPDLARLGLENEFNPTREGWLELFPPEAETEGFFLTKMLKGK